MAKVYLYGKLRAHLSAEERERGYCELSITEPANLLGILTSLHLEIDQLATIFINSKLLVTRNSMAPYLQYQQLRSSTNDWDLNIPIQADDRVGVFGMDMALLVV